MKSRLRKMTPEHEEKLLKILTGMIAEKTGETRGEVLSRIAERAEELQRRDRYSRQRATKRSTSTPSTQAQVAAKART